MCTEWQLTVKKFEGGCKALETLVRNTNLSFEKDAQKRRELTCRYNEAQETITEL